MSTAPEANAAPTKAPHKGNLLFLGLSQAFRMGAGFAISVMLMRLLGVEGFGVYAYVTTLVGLFGFGSHLGMNNLLNREIARDHSLAERYVATGLLSTTLLSVLTGLCIVAWAWLLDGRSLVVAAALVASVALGLRSVAMMPVAAFHAVRRMGLGVQAHMVGRVVLVAFTALFLWLQLDVVSVFMAQVIDGIVTLVLVALVFRKEIGALSMSASWVELRSMVRRSVPFGLNALFGSIYLTVDVVMLQHFRGDAEVGEYRAATMILSLLALIADTFSQGLFPRMARHLGQPQKAGEELRFATRVLLALGLPASVGGILLALPIMLLLGGQEYAGSATLFAVMAPLVPLRFLNNSFSMTLSTLNRQSDRTKGVMLAAAFNVLANLVALPHYGALGAAVTTLLTELLLGAWLRWRIQPLVSGLGLGGTLLRAALPTAVMAGVLLLLPPMHVLLAIAAGALVFGIVGRLTGAWTMQDLRRLRRV